MQMNESARRKMVFVFNAPLFTTRLSGFVAENYYIKNRGCLKDSFIENLR